MLKKNRDWFAKLLKKVGHYQLERQAEINPTSSDHKSRIDLVTDVDRESERRLVKALEQRFPADGILAEEEIEKSSENDCRWIIDPLDGTTNYVHHHPFFGISIGRQKQGKLSEAYAYFPYLDDFYCAGHEEGAFKNDARIEVSKNSDPLKALMATGFADMRTESERYNLPVFQRIIRDVQGIRRAGSAVHDLCLTAEGVFDGFWEYNLSAWDVAAGALLVKEAGGKVTDMAGGDDWLTGKHIVASNATSLHGWLLEKVDVPQ